jgi:lysyl-tRNA synthetase class I
MNFHNKPASHQEQDEILQKVSEQYRELKDAWPIKVTCASCGKQVNICDHAYKCFYCGLWFCWTCSKEHFKEKPKCS